MKKILISFFAFTFYFLLAPYFLFFVHAQEFQQKYHKAEVTKIVEENMVEIEGSTNLYQKIEVKILEGEQKDKVIIVEHGGNFKINESQKIKTSDQVVLVEYNNGVGETIYSITDKYRLDQLVLIAASFLIVVLAVAGKRGMGAIIGLTVSFIVLMNFVVPRILSGGDPLWVSIFGSLMIMSATLYLAHGFKKQTTLALASTFISLLITGVLVILASKIGNLTGLGSEEAYSLQLGGGNINIQGLFLGGVIIGALGALDDITTTQTATVFEIFKTDNRLPFRELVKKGMKVGKEHIASLVNTLVLAYAGVSLPLFLLFILNPQQTPSWVILNSELVAEEIVRTLTGSIGLVLAVPISTVLAAHFAKKN